MIIFGAYVMLVCTRSVLLTHIYSTSCLYLLTFITSPSLLFITESEESVRVVKSAKVRAFEAFETNVKSLRNAMRNNDHKTLMEEFDVLSKAMTKSTKVFESNGGIPRFLVRILCDLEDHVAKCLADKASFKKLKPAQGRALNRIKLSLKKNNEPYKGIMDEYRKNPVVSESDKDGGDSSSSSSESESEDEKSDDDSSSSSSSSSSSAPAAKKKKPKKADSDSVSSEPYSLPKHCHDECCSIMDIPRFRDTHRWITPTRITDKVMLE